MALSLRGGGNTEGELGLGHTGGSEYLPRVVESLRGFNVCAVAAGNGFGSAITATGCVYTWGNGICGRLGHGDTIPQCTPSRIEALRDAWVVAVSLAKYHAIAVTHEGDVLGWGRAAGLGLPDAAAVAVSMEEDEHGSERNEMCIMSPQLYTRVSCGERRCT